MNLCKKNQKTQQQQQKTKPRGKSQLSKILKPQGWGWELYIPAQKVI